MSEGEKSELIKPVPTSGEDSIIILPADRNRQKRTRDEESDTSHPIKRPPRSQSESNRKFVIPTKNAYNILEETVQDIESENDESEMETEKLPTEDTNKNGRPPPVIVLHGKPQDHRKLVGQLQNTATAGFSIKYTKENTNIQTKSMYDWNNTKELLVQHKVHFHTYTPNSEKNHAFVLNGLDHSPDAQEVVTGLTQEHKLATIKIFLMRNTVRPKYLVITNNKITENRLAKINELLHCKISWERYVNSKTVIQCHKCQLWGHATSNCNGAPSCLKCAGNHTTKDCTKTQDAPARCVNCNGNHPANSIECSVYKDILRNRKTNAAPWTNPTQKYKINDARQFPPLQPKYKPAPAPTSNPWQQQRRSQAENSNVISSEK